jgi:hypothetical protein
LCPLAARHITAAHAQPRVWGMCRTGLMPLWSLITSAEIVLCVAGLAVILLGFWMGRPRGVRKCITACHWFALIPTVLLVIALTQAVQIKHSEAARKRQWDRFSPRCPGKGSLLLAPVPRTKDSSSPPPAPSRAGP